MTPLLYLVYREALSSVISSQVLTPLEALRPATDVTLGLFTPCGQLLRSKFQPVLSQIEKRCQSSGIKVGWLPSPPTRMPWLWSDSFVLRRWIQRHFRKDQPLIVRCRNSSATRIALDAFRDFPQARIIFDCRGAEVTETAQRLGYHHLPESEWPPVARDKLQAVMRDEQRAVLEADGVTCVSQAMVDQLRATYPDQPANKFFVVPCCPDTDAFFAAAVERDRVRKELGLTDKLVVTYVGSLAWYQLPEASFRIFKVIKSIRPDAHFFAITTQPDKMRELSLAAGLESEDITIRSVSSREVPGLLVASDLGLMLRDDSLTNRVASPVKFGEYIAAGVPVIITSQLGDYSHAVGAHDLGVVVKLEQPDAVLADILHCIVHQSDDETEARRNRCLHYAATQLSWQKVIPQLNNWYHGLHLPPGIGLTTTLESR